jgi:hypothetical protein
MVVRDRPVGRGVGWGGLGLGARHWRMKGPKGIMVVLGSGCKFERDGVFCW